MNLVCVFLDNPRGHILEAPTLLVEVSVDKDACGRFHACSVPYWFVEVNAIP